jgi:hypothetical protein
MTSKGLIVVWLLFALSIFCAGYIATHIFVTRVMADFKVEPEPTYTQWLHVEPNYGTQTDQYTPIQPAVTPTGKEL